MPENIKSGRNVFRRWRGIILFLCAVTSFLPKISRVYLLDVFSGFPGRIGVGIRYILVRTLVKTCGENIYIGRWCVFKNLHNLSLGSNISFHERVYIDAVGNISVGSDVSFAHSVSIISFEHRYETCGHPFKYQPLDLKRVCIASNVWVGCGVRILAGSVIDSDVVVAANSVTKKHLTAGVYAGTPAIKVKELL
ncbi:acetyltransferase [Rahnella victoriana]|uniref:acyltransferase n=1 Tax=Rahnella victoriana TaxID=1510570 RepID=UPI000BB16EB8|nr:acetyltransferase [Rahnella victoriana]PBI81958.1 acetyltransferase [Rahnella victoriana]